MKLKYLFFLLLIVNSCIEQDSKKNSSISITGQKFENTKAKELNDLGIKKAKDGKHDSAEDLFFQALKLEPDNPTVLSNIGLCYQNQEMNDKAIEYHKKSLIASDSTYLISGVNLGNVYYQTGQYSKGIEILDFVIKNTEEDRLLTVAHVNRGFNYYGKRDCKKANMELAFVKGRATQYEDVKFQINRLEQRIKNCVQHNL